MIRNKLVLNISKTKSTVFGTNHSLNHNPQLNLVINNVGIEQVEVTKLLGVTLHCKLSWSKHIDTTVAKMVRNLSTVKGCLAFFLTLSTRHVLQALVLPHLDYCSVVWSGATKRDLVKLQLAPNGAALLLDVRRELALIICMSISPGSKWRRD